MPDKKTDALPELRRAVIAGGSGAVGTLLSRSLRASGVEVLIADSHRPPRDELQPVTYLECDVAAGSSELHGAIERADALFVCLPEAAAVQAFPFLTSALRDQCLWVDTLSVKADVARMLNETGGRFQAVSINPMFAPGLGWSGQCVATMELTIGPASSAFKELLRQWGARVEETTPGEHDRLTGLIQVATHAALVSAGAALLSADVSLDRLLKFATPPHKLLLLLMHRLTTQSADVYWDIQAFHPYGTEVRNELIEALRAIELDVQNQDKARFVELLGGLRSLFKDDEELFRKWAQKIFTP